MAALQKEGEKTITKTLCKASNIEPVSIVIEMGHGLFNQLEEKGNREEADEVFRVFAEISRIITNLKKG